MGVCEECGEYLNGDGYTTPISCPNADVEDLTPDGDVVYCNNRGTKERVDNESRTLWC